MTVTHTWAVNFVDASGTTDLTAYTLGFQINQNVQIARMSNYTGQMTLSNQTNIFTPNAGGTHQTFKWFEKIIKITCAINDGSTTSTADVAHLVVTDIDFRDDGQRSTVQLTLNDFFVYTARDAVSVIDVTAAYGTLDVICKDMMNGTPSGVEAVPFPKFGAGTGAPATVTAITKMNEVDPVETDTYPIGFSGIIEEFDDGTCRDYINNQILPSGPAFVYPTTAAYDGAANKWTLNANYVNRLMTKTNAYKLFTLRGVKAADTFPIKKISTQYNTFDTINQAQIQSYNPASGSGPTFSNDTTSQGAIGVRSVSYNKIIPVVFGGATDTQKAVIGDFWVNRFSEVTYTPQQATLTMESIDQYIDSSSRQNYANFLSVSTALWGVVAITYTPKGADAAQSYNCVIAGRQLFVSPESTTISLQLLPAAENQGFRLDDANIGVLGANRLG